MAWTLSDIRSKLRGLTGRSSTADLSDAAANNLINDYYRYDFPHEVQLERLDDTWSQALAVTDDGEYSVSEDYIEITPPMMLNGEEELRIFMEQDDFWRLYPANEDYTSNPTLAIGSSSEAAVANAAFTYDVSGYQYSKDAAETALSGDTVPQNKYGAWMLSIDADGDITVTEASDNATGYASPAKAVEAIPTADTTDAVMGFVVVINTSGTFVPGTTLLSDAGVTDTYTDGHPDLRGRPEAVLLSRNNGKAYVRPKPDDAYVIRSQAVLQRPTAMSGDSSTPLDEAWGLALALGASVKFLATKEGEAERMTELFYGNSPTPMPGCLVYELNQIRRKQLIQQDIIVERYW